MRISPHVQYDKNYKTVSFASIGKWTYTYNIALNVKLRTRFKTRRWPSDGVTTMYNITGIYPFRTSVANLWQVPNTQGWPLSQILLDIATFRGSQQPELDNCYVLRNLFKLSYPKAVGSRSLPKGGAHLYGIIAHTTYTKCDDFVCMGRHGVVRVPNKVITSRWGYKKGPTL